MYQTAKAPDISIQEAARTGNIEAVKQHLAAGTDVDWFDEPVGRLGHSVVIDKTTALHYAVFGGQKDVAEILIANGADVNAKNFQSKSRQILPSNTNNPNSPTSSVNTEPRRVKN